MCRRKVRLPSCQRASTTIFIHDPWVGVRTYLNRLGRVARNAWVSLRGAPSDCPESSESCTAENSSHPGL